ncbi:hypothetical protein NDU88_008266 [Pleurodeles waltl]|uniref:Uncharacterized protein n=1 Tax=Pleurodeles waltl TaxID=8319 RepID=A0AAV7NVJ6_PLEWA|nr:hypothetical protein NDU88_008266 [Pleurodeles waltl]
MIQTGWPCPTWCENIACGERCAAYTLLAKLRREPVPRGETQVQLLKEKRHLAGRWAPEFENLWVLGRYCHYC